MAREKTKNGFNGVNEPPLKVAFNAPDKRSRQQESGSVEALAELGRG